MSAQPTPILFPPRAAAPAVKPSRRRVVLLALVLALAAGGGWYALEQREIAVQVVSPQYGDIASTVSSMGTVIPVHDFPARAQFSGMVEKIYVHVGEKVHAGQMLVEMKDQYALPRLRNAVADLKSAQLSLENVENNGSQEDRITFAADLKRAQMERDAAATSLATLKQLQQRGSVSDAEVLAGMQRLQSATTNLNALQQRMRRRYSPDDLASWKAKVSADAADVAAERVSWGNAHIVTPIAGTVYIIPVSPYDFVPAGSELLHVADLSKLEVRADFFEPDIGSLRVGEPVTIAWDGAPGRSWKAHVVSKPMAVDRNGALSTGRCLIALDSGSDLPVNTSVTVVVAVQKHDHVLTIPREALHGAGGAQFVYRVADGRLNKTPVTVGLLNAMRAEITAGLQAKDVVVLHATENQALRNNARVKIENSR